MNSEPQEPIVPQFTDGFSRARSSALIAAGLLILVVCGKVDLTKPIPLLGLSIPDVGVVKLVLCFIAAYGMFRMIIEWFQTHSSRRQLTSSRIDFSLSLILVFSSIAWYLLQPFDFQSLAHFPFLSSSLIVGFGFYFGSTLGVGIQMLQYVRSKEDALRLGLHRRPFAVRAVHRGILFSLVILAVIFTLSPNFKQPLSNVWAFLFLGPAMIGLLGSIIGLIHPKRHKSDTKANSRKEHVASMLRILNWHDAIYQANGWDKRAPCKQTPLYEACERGDIEAVKSLLKIGVAINFQGVLGWTPLMIAVAQQHLPIVELLLKNGANPNVANFLGRTPLAFAARYDRKDILELLLKNGANPNFRDGCFFEPPLEIAAHYGHKQIIDILLKAGADPTAKGHMKISPLDSAEASQHGDIASKLRKAALKNKRLML